MSLPRENSRREARERANCCTSKKLGGCIIDTHAQQDFPTVPSSRLNRNTIGGESGEFSSRLLVARLFIQPDRKVDGPSLPSFLLAPFFHFEFSRHAATPPLLSKATHRWWWSFSARVEFTTLLEHASVIPLNWFARKTQCLFRSPLEKSPRWG